MGDDKSGRHVSGRAVEGRQPGQGFAGLLESRRVDKADNFPIIYPDRIVPAGLCLAGEGADADAVVLGQGGDH